MNHSWADSPHDQQGPGPSRTMQTMLIILVLTSTAVGIAWMLQIGLNRSEASCYENAPAGSSVTTTLRWFPPGYDCHITTR